MAGPLFVATFTAIGARRPGYDWRRHTVSSLAAGDRGWQQRVSFIVTGALYVCAASGLRRGPARVAGPLAVPALVAAAGLGLVGSGVFVTDPFGGDPPTAEGVDAGSTSSPLTPTREGTLHSLCAIPILAGIPVAEVASALHAARRTDYRWASLSAGSSLMMVGSFLAFGASYGRAPRLKGKGGVFQRASISSGLLWLTVLSLRALRATRHA